MATEAVQVDLNKKSMEDFPHISIDEADKKKDWSSGMDVTSLVLIIQVVIILTALVMDMQNA